MEAESQSYSVRNDNHHTSPLHCLDGDRVMLFVVIVVTRNPTSNYVVI